MRKAQSAAAVSPLRLLADTPLDKRTARFRCVVALTPVLRPESRPASPVCYADELELQTELCEGACEGPKIACTGQCSGTCTATEPPVAAAISTWSIFLALGLATVAPTRFAKQLLAMVGVFMFGVATLAPFTTIAPAYAQSKPLTVDDGRLTAATQLNVVLGAGDEVGASLREQI